MTIELRYRDCATVPLEVEGILPETLRAKPLADVQRMPVFHGNEQADLGDFFDVSGDSESDRLVWIGNLSGVHWIGAKMKSGEIAIDGDAGRHVGSEMRGGRIHVSGDAGDWVGAEMKGGLVHVDGSAGHLIGAAYRGSARGMTGGSILIRGNAGNEIGHTMRRGLLAVGGNIGDLAGFNMLAGTILTFGECGIRHGAGMRRGTLGFFGTPPDLLLSFGFACRYRPEVLELVFRELRRLDFPVSEELLEAPVDLYYGDQIEGGRGEVWLRT